MPNDLPPIDERLIKALADIYPDRCPSPNTPERDIWMDAGRADVVRFLASKFQEQNETLFED